MVLLFHCIFFYLGRFLGSKITCLHFNLMGSEDDDEIKVGTADSPQVGQEVTDGEGGFMVREAGHSFCVLPEVGHEVGCTIPNTPSPLWTMMNQGFQEVSGDVAFFLPRRFWAYPEHFSSICDISQCRAQKHGGCFMNLVFGLPWVFKLGDWWMEMSMAVTWNWCPLPY